MGNVVNDGTCNTCIYRSDYSNQGCAKCVTCGCVNGEHSNYEREDK